MAETYERACVGCGEAGELIRLEQCHICRRHFCSDCGVKAGFGRRFCSLDCSRAYYFTGESDDEDAEQDD